MSDFLILLMAAEDHYQTLYLKEVPITCVQIFNETCLLQQILKLLSVLLKRKTDFNYLKEFELLDNYFFFILTF